MTPQIAFLLGLIVVMVYLFLSERLPVDLTAFLGLVVLVFGGYVTPGEAFQGFSSPAVITMLSVFIVGAALLETGVADRIGGRILLLVGDSEARLIVVLMLVCGAMSAFMNNIAATAVLMPAVAAIARRASLASSRLFMPLAFGAILGGTTTLVGTPPNILAAEMLAERGLEPFALFDFAPVGLVILGVGTLFMVTVGRRLLPTREDRGPAPTAAGDLVRVYQLEERLFSLRIPQDSPLDGLTLAKSRLGNALGVKLLAIVRGDSRRLAPDGETVLQAGDVLYVEGRAADLEELLRLRSLEIERTGLGELPAPVRNIEGVRARVVRGSSLAGRSLRELKFRERFGLVVVGIESDGMLRRVHLGEEVLREGDEIVALGRHEDLAAAARLRELEVIETGPAALEELAEELFTIRVPAGSSLVGVSIARSRLGELTGLTVGALIRGEEAHVAISPDEELRVDDRLLLAAEPSRIETLEELGDVLLEDAGPGPLESEAVGMVEVAIAPRSDLVGHTLRELGFRERYGLLALALWREGTPRHVNLGRLPLRFGDALLLHGPRQKIAALVSEPGLVVLSGVVPVPRRTNKAPLALACLALMVGLVVTGYQPIHIAAFTAASLAILSGALTMPEAYRVIEWKAIFLVAAVLPVGVAMERTGAALLLADGVTALAGPLGHYATLAALVVLASLLSQGLDGAPSVVLLAPVVLHTAEGLGVSPYPMMMGVGLSASAAFMTPFSHKANLLVMGAGGYRSSDYARVGSPLTLVILAIIVLLVPVFFPF